VSERLSLRQSLILLLAVLVFLAAAAAVAMTRIPWCDEAWFACAGFNLAAHGKLITPVIAAAFLKAHAGKADLIMGSRNSASRFPPRAAGDRAACGHAARHAVPAGL